MEEFLSRMSLPPELTAILKKGNKVTLPESRSDLLNLALGVPQSIFMRFLTRSLREERSLKLQSPVVRTEL
jgi:hypothetical protein